MLVKLATPLPEICRKMRFKEATLRRIVTAFAKAEDLEGSSVRREVLMSDTPATLRETYVGTERLNFLCAVNCKSSSVSPLNEDTYVVALICSYLPFVLRGGTSFALHTIMRGPVGCAEFTGQTQLISLDPATKTFTMMECEVAPERAVVVLVMGQYKQQMSSSFSSLRLQLRCSAKQDGILRRGKEWDWSDKEKIPKEEAPVLMYSLKYDAKRDGMIAESSTARLKELTVQELLLLRDLYSGKMNIGEMQQHRSWGMLPSGSVEREHRDPTSPT
jgi:hypothetical protein